MECPDCAKNNVKTKLKVMDSRPEGPYKRNRRYACQKCGYETHTTERLDIPAS